MFFGFTALQSFVLIILLFIVIYWLLPKNLSWISYLVLVLLLSSLAFNVEPNESDDLYRYFDTLNFLRNGGKEAWDTCIENKWNSWNIYRVCGWYFYLISRLPNNHYMPAITIFIVYGLMFMVINNISKRYDASKVDTFIGSMFFISTYWYYDTVSGIRNGLAFAVVFTCAYYHLMVRKHIPLCIIGYVLACFTHSAAIMPVVLIALAILTLNNSGKYINFLLIFGIIGGGIGIQFLASAFPGNEFLQSIAGKAETNGLGDSLYTDTLYLTNVVTVVLVAIIVLYYSYYILRSDQSKEIKLLYKFCSIVIYFVIGSLYSVLIFMRFARWVIPIIGALFIIVGRKTQEDVSQEKGADFMKYFAPFTVRIRYQTKTVFSLVIVAYIIIHFWYLCAGSSLNWIHF